MNKNEIMLPIVRVDINKIKTDPTYQRVLNAERVASMVNNYSPSLVRLPFVSRRKDGSIYAYDGQHTIAMLKALGVTGEINVYCNDGLTQQQEADEFIRLNANGWEGRLQVPVCTRFDAAIVAKRPEQLEIKSIAQSLGLDVGSKAHAIRAIEALSYAHANGNLKKTLFTLHTWCPEDRRRFDNALIRGVSAFYSKYPDADERRLITALNDQKLAPCELKARFARQKKTYGQYDASYCGQIDAILDIYNKGLKGSRRL